MQHVLDSRRGASKGSPKTLDKMKNKVELDNDKSKERKQGRMLDHINSWEEMLNNLPSHI